ncbi:OmpA family protein [bacterium]|nr:OmpA family protein [bacterium]
MSKKKAHAEEHVNHERWLVSYADFITLLFAFFVVLFSSAQVDSSKSQAMSVAMERAFERFSIFKYVSGDEIGQSNSGSAAGNTKKYRDYLMRNEEGVPIMVPSIVSDVDVMPKGLDDSQDEKSLSDDQSKKMAELEKLSQVQMQIMDILGKNDEKKMEVKREARGVVISLKEAALFQANSTEISPDMLPFLTGISYILSGVPNFVRVEGYSGASNIQEAWSISAKRSGRVIEWLSTTGKLDAKRFVSIAYGNQRSRHLEAENDDRVDIVLMSRENEKYR